MYFCQLASRALAVRAAQSGVRPQDSRTAIRVMAWFCSGVRGTRMNLRGSSGVPGHCRHVASAGHAHFVERELMCSVALWVPGDGDRVTRRRCFGQCLSEQRRNSTYRWSRLPLWRESRVDGSGQVRSRVSDQFVIDEILSFAAETVRSSGQKRTATSPRQRPLLPPLASHRCAHVCRSWWAWT
jgi:hypothetical protein